MVDTEIRGPDLEIVLSVKDWGGFGIDFFVDAEDFAALFPDGAGATVEAGGTGFSFLDKAVTVDFGTELRVRYYAVEDSLPTYERRWSWEEWK